MLIDRLCLLTRCLLGGSSVFVTCLQKFFGSATLAATSMSLLGELSRSIEETSADQYRYGGGLKMKLRKRRLGLEHRRALASPSAKPVAAGKRKREVDSADNLPWRRISSRLFSAGEEDGMLELDEVSDVEVLFEETDGGRVAKFRVSVFVLLHERELSDDCR